ncbi:MAG: UDP-3-O-(3-hydroxymyristoyl)glucosamine N-acyltransferase [Nevskiales bacterium]
MTLTLGELASQLGLELRGDAALKIMGVCALAPGKSGHLSFLAEAKYAKQLADTRAAAVILHPKQAADWTGNALLTPRPHVAFARIAALFEQRVKPEPGVHPTAWVSPQAKVDASASIGAMSVVQAGAEIGPKAEIGPGCVVGHNVKIGAGTRLVARVTLCDRVQVGQRCTLEPGAVIGARGFGLAKDGERWIEVPQLGSVVIGDDVEIGANNTVDRGALEDTVIEDGVKFDDQVHVGHNCRVGKHTVMAGQSALAGSTTLGAGCVLGGRGAVLDHLEVAAGVVLTACSMVTKSVTEAGVYSASFSAVPIEEWRRQRARVYQLDEMAERLRLVEKKLGGAGETDPGTGAERKA